MTNTADEFKEGRARPTNYIQICRNLADSYPSIPHGVQKDAIQNALDAKTGREGVHVVFDLFENKKGRFFAITDSNTSGLTGPVLGIDETAENLPDHYHWARFESFAFTKKSPDSLGARGQGKFIFLNASNNYTMYYDSFREDGVYRVGATRATETGCPILPPEGDDPWENIVGENILFKQLGITRLTSVGTRVIIVEPTDQLVQAVSGHLFEQAIKETWFRAIEKKQLSVHLNVFGVGRDLVSSESDSLPQNDTKTIKIWTLGSDFKKNEIRTSDGTKYRVKRFCAVYEKGKTLPEELQGIAIIQNGMKICSLITNFLPPETTECLTGYIEFDRALDQELRKGINQDPSHYNLRWRSAVSRAIKIYIEEALREFGRQKLGIRRDNRELRKQSQKDAEKWAMQQLQKFAKDLDLFGAMGTVRHRANEFTERSSKEVGITINNFVFPFPEIAPRVNWGDKFTDVSVTAFNKTNVVRNLGLGR